jgi:membrane-associated phospholipid phosphatase
VGVLALACAERAGAQGTLGKVGRTIGSDVKTAFGDVWHVWTAPVHATPRDWMGAGAAAGAFLVAMPFDDDVDRFVREHPSAVPTDVMVAFSDTGSISLIKWGSAHRTLQVSGGLYLVGLVSGKSALRDAGMGCAMSVVASNVPRQIIYQLVARDRPRIAGGDQYRWKLGHGEWEKHSFFAGHAANAMACAAFLDERFRLGLVEPVLYAYAAGVGLGRMADERHWTSDTILGLIFGYAVGRSVALRSKGRVEERREQRSALSAPFRNLTAWQDGESLRLGWNAEF